MRHQRARRVVTLHAPLGKAVAQDLLQAIEKLLKTHGASQVWVSHEGLPNLEIMARVPEKGSDLEEDQ